MVKKFGEVFHTLKLNDYQISLVDNIYVEKIKKNDNLLNIYIISNTLILRQDFINLEKIMTSEYKIGINIIPRYNLKSNYSSIQIFEAVKEDIAIELKKEGLLMYKLFTEAAFDFYDDTQWVAKVPNLYAYEIRLERFKYLIEKIFSDKFGKIIIIKFELVDMEGEKHRSTTIKMDMINIPKEKKVTQDVKKDNIDVNTLETISMDTENKSTKKKNTKFSKLIKDNIDSKTTKIIDIGNIPGNYTVDISILNTDIRELRSGLHLFVISMTDFTDSIVGRLFIEDEDFDYAFKILSKGNFLRVTGRCDIDEFDREFKYVSIKNIQLIDSFRSDKTDNEEIKRIELCAHTKMSKMEAVCDIKHLINRAYKWGHKAIAITDFGVVHGFPNAMNAAKQLDDFKVIYGMSANMVDDQVNFISNPIDASIDDEMVIFDIETTGFSAKYDKIIEIGAVKIKNGALTGEVFQEFINPQRPLPYEIINLTKITDDDLIPADTIDKVLKRFLEFCGDVPLCAHNASFDMSFIRKNAEDLGLSINNCVLDTLLLSRRLIKDIKNHKLGSLAKKFKIDLKHAHRANDDAKATAEVLINLLNIAKNEGCEKLEDLNKKLGINAEDKKMMYPFNATLLAKNDIGRINLYTLVSISHLKYFRVNAKLPKTLINEYREGILIGTGNIDGELQQAILKDTSEAEIEELLKFYDYVEVQPPSIYLADNKRFDSIDKVQEHIRKIIEYAKNNNKIIVATGDVHFIDEEDEIYRKIIKYGDKKTLKQDIPLFFRTTKEMLDEFSFLGANVAREIVIYNTHIINDMIENISPVRPDKCPPIIQDSDKELRRICYDKAHSIYGENLPDVVKNRLEKELNSIIGNGFAVMYIIAQKLVKKSNDDGYIVGSRGSVGSSFVATMAGITEVNPLQPHYYCENCHYNEFNSKDIKENIGICGCDLPDKICPVCGTKLKKEGFDIPFETFLGFKGNKEPDIDLNFSGEYQARAHKETENIFGKGQTFRAGTISVVADKTAFGYVKGYLEENEISKRKCEIERLALGVSGAKKTTGQHPGGIIVLPKGENIYSFTPIQRPADDENSNIITTHFDYHSIDHNLLKLDILGHDDPTMIKRLEDLTGIDAKTVPFDEPKVMSIFHSPEALGISSEDILGCKVGCRGIPEFGTDFTINMVIDTKPKNFTDLLKISGLSHGTDVWVGNAQELINSGKATISECICTRDDIMTFLIAMGLDQELAFTIMESVRKGKGLKPEWEEEIRNHNIPEWYIWSCNKIKYMFPKAHAVAYVMMAYRIAFFKVYYPLEYYAAFFSIRASAFNYKLMCLGKAKLESEIRRIKEIKNPSKIEKDTLKDMLIVQEFYARGFEFTKIDLYKAHHKEFKIFDGKIMPSLSVIEGVGDKAAALIVEEANKVKFISKNDLKNRCKLSNTCIEVMSELGILEGLPETNQISIFDLENYT